MLLNTPSEEFVILISTVDLVNLSAFDRDRLYRKFGSSIKITQTDPNSMDLFLDGSKVAVTPDFSNPNVLDNLLNTSVADLPSFSSINPTQSSPIPPADLSLGESESIKDIPDIKYTVNTTTNTYEDGTYFKIGPHVYGGEVQSIRIAEQKALTKLSGVRTNSDFLIDSGTGEADVEVILLFKDNHAIINHLIPLVALFKISPITSVRNKVINDALLNEFTENDALTPTQVLGDAFDKVLASSISQLKRQIFIDAHTKSTRSGPTVLDNITEQIFNEFHAIDPNNSLFTKWPSFSDYENDSKLEAEDDLYLFDNTVEAGIAASNKFQDSIQTNPKVTRYLHTPMAMVSLDIQSHPELPEAVIVKLFLRRIDTENYLRGALLYRNIDNHPTEDGLKAYWLRRALDIYIDDYIDPDWVFGKHINDNKGDITLSFMGENILLRLFAKKNFLDKIVMNSSSDEYLGSTGTVVSQMTYSIQNKFSFPRLAGKSYPTAQFMGASSGSISMAISTNDPEKFKEIHKYKSAADFFVRTSDRIDRFNGWRIDSWLTRLFNNNLKPDQRDPEDGRDDINNRFPSSAWYPINVSTSTNPSFPELRDINIGFAETNPDFFSDFGFTVKRGSYDIAELKKFFDELFDRALAFRSKIEEKTFNELLTSNDLAIDRYSFNLFFGNGTSENEWSIINHSSIVAAFLEYYSSKGEPENHKLASLQGAILTSLENNPIFTETVRESKLNYKEKAERIIRDISLDEDGSISTLLASLFFDSNDTKLIKKIDSLAENQGRRDLYSYLWRSTNIEYTRLFKDRLFNAIVQRRSPAYERLYDQAGVVNGYNSLVLALEAKGEEILDKESFGALSQTAKTEAKIIIDGNKFKSTRGIPTCYPDYPLITYGRLFNLGSALNDFELFAPRYKHFGIDNNLASHGFDGSTAYPEVNSTTVSRAQNEVAVTADSPIPPSAFFYREDEFTPLLENLEEEVEEWFDKITQHRLDLPFDMEGIVKDSEYDRSTGRTQSKPGVSPGFAARAENVVEKTKKSIGRNRFKDAAGDIILSMARHYAKVKGIDVGDIETNDATRAEFGEEVQKLVRGDLSRNTKLLNAEDSSVPILMGTALGSDIRKWKAVTGVWGEGIAKNVLSKAIGDDTNINQFIDTTLTTSASGLKGETISGANEDESKASMLRIMQSLPDNANDTIKAFPAMRLYLIDFVGPRIIVQDNFYGYHSIISIDITLDKHDADLAVVKMADPFHVLQGSAFNNDVRSSKNKIGDTVLPASTNDIESKNILSRVALKQGRAVQIRGGYSADPDNLDILFTGRIAEVTFGEEVTIVCQGWKAELIGRQVSFGVIKNDTENTSVKDLVVETIRHAGPAGFGDIYPAGQAQKIFEIANTLSVGQQIFHSMIKNQGTTSTGGGVAAGFTASFIGIDIATLTNKGLDLRLKNVWVPDVDRKNWSYFASVADSQWQGTGWTVPIQSAWETLQQATNYLWGYICQVVPYDSEATLFFGKPDQLYYYTNGSKRQKITNKKNKSAESYKLINASINEIYERFLVSSYYDEDFRKKALSEAGGRDFTAVFKESDPFSSHIEIHNIFYVPLIESSRRWNTFFAPHAWTTHYYMHNPIYETISESLGLAKETGPSEPGKPSIVRNEATPLAKAMRTKDLNAVYKKLSNDLGGSKKADMLIFSKFFGLNIKFVNEKINDSSLMKELLGSNEITRKRRAYLLSLFGNETGAKEVLDSFGTKGALAVSSRELQLAIQWADRISPDRIEGIKVSQVEYEFNAFDYAQERLKQFASRGVSPRISQSSYTITDLREIATVIISTPGKDTDAIYPMYVYAKGVGANAELTKGENGEPATLIISIPRSLRQIDRTKLGKIIIGFEDRDFKLLSDSLRNMQSQAEHSNSVTFADDNLAFSNEDSLLRRFGHVAAFGNGLESSSQMVDFIINNIPLLKSFVYYIEQFTSRSSFRGERDNVVQDSIEILRSNSKFDFSAAANMKVFRDFHYIRDGVDIIENNIAASTREMFNSVVVRYPSKLETSNDRFWGDSNTTVGGAFNFNSKDIEISGETTWTSWPPSNENGQLGMQFSANIVLQDKKVAVYTDLNSTTREQAAKVASNVLTKNIRPMYRNNLLVMGRAIKPWDYIYLDDKFVDMYGPLDTERVVHHYNATTGWQTNIVPHAVCEANSGNSYMQTAIFNSKVDRIFNALDYALWGWTFLSLGWGVGIQGTKAALSTGGLIGTGVKESFGIFSKDGIKKAFAGTAVKATTTGQQYKVLGRALQTGGPAALRSLLIGPLGIGFGAGKISRLIIKNYGAGKEQLPVIFMPLVHKQIALEAGLGGEDIEYWSLASRLHWGLKDLKDGFNMIFNDLQRGLRPNGSRSANALGITRNAQQ
jgi:hypothetical protein